MENTNQFEWLMNFSTSPQGILLIAAPLLLVGLAAGALAIASARKRKIEFQELEDAMRDEGGAPQGKTQEKADDEDAWTGDFAEGSPAPLDKDAENWSQDLGVATADPVFDQRDSSEFGWLQRLRTGLAKTRQALIGGVSTIFSGQTRMDDAVLERLHEVLYRADLGTEATERLVHAVKKETKGQESASWENIRPILHREALAILSDLPKPSEVPSGKLRVILVTGVNGVGKTTTIGKLATYFADEGLSVVLAAADTFRAAAIDQLKVWGDRAGVPVIAKQEGGDPAAVVHDALASARAKKADVLIVDTAGRLQNKTDLMAELEKIFRVIKKEVPDAPHDSWLVIDATTGQNAFSQVKAFQDVAKINGIIVTKLDGTAKGGVVLGVCQQFKLPIRYVGVGEKAHDLDKFDAEDFVDMLFDEP